ncbi:MAG: uroporphyrinogen-III synthase [Gammaproteobacteria bacterium]
MTKFDDALTILVTRPDPQGFELCAELTDYGFQALHLPTIDFAPIPVSENHEVLNTLANQDWLIFISPHAVYASVPYIRQRWPELPANVKFAAVGAGTAKALKNAGYLAIYPIEGVGADYLLALPEFQNVANKQITLIKGDGGREVLQDVLKERGAHVSMFIAYNRTLPRLETSLYLTLLQTNKIDAIVCTSYDGVRNLKTLIGEKHWTMISVLPLIVVSERIKTLAHDLGYQTIWVAVNANHQAILDVLEQKKEALCKIKQTKISNQPNNL